MQGPSSPDPHDGPAELKPHTGVSFEIQRRLSSVNHYNRWIHDQFRPYAGRRILDVGCAIGNITQFWLDRELVVGIDIDEEFVHGIQERFGDRANFRAEVADIADPTVRALGRDEIDTVVCVNVLEHVRDDDLALQNMKEVLSPGGRLCLLVPAFQFLFGTMDEADHHYRRYRRPALARKLKESGFVLENIYYMNVLGILGWFINGRVLKRRLVSTSQYSFYDRLVPLLAWAERVVRPPFGLSLVAVARKP
jgi:2-polyprenyl-3-methyl-5-hydroxy-6-metoxy-1,4-benzoquinol methylase